MQRVGGTLAALLLLIAACSGDDAGEPAPAANTDPVERSADPDNGDEEAESSAASATIPARISLAWQEIACGAPTMEVATANELHDALANAVPGDVILLGAGTYEGAFVATAEASEEQPIFLCGPGDAVLDGGGVKAGYGFHLDGASGWRLVGFAVRNAQKGVMADGATGNVIQGLLVEHIGDEAIHLRSFSTGNVVRDNEIHDTGLRRDKFGEGVYIGSAVSNWEKHSGGEPDRSDGNVVEGNRIWDTSSEAVDIKEGTTGGILRNNTFDGSETTAADSWVDVKGNGWLIEGNAGVSSPLDGFQVHEIEEGWGTGNTFTANTADVAGDCYGFNTTSVDGNVVRCDNEVTGAKAGFADIDCTS